MPLITRWSISRSISRPVRSISPSTTSSMAERLPHGLEKTSLSSSCWVGIRISPDGVTIRLLSCAPAGAAVLRIASRAIDQRRTGILAPPLLVSPSTADQVEQLLLAQASARFRPLQELGREVAFIAVQPHDPLLNAVLHDQPVDRHRPLLANPMRPVRSLVLHRRVPPGVKVDHVVRRRQVQPSAPRAQADQEQLRPARLERRDPARALGSRGAAVEILVADSVCVQRCPYEVQVADKLAEDQGLVPVADQFFDQIEEGVQLAARHPGSWINQGWVAAGPPQPGDLGKDVDLARPLGSIQRGDALQRSLAQRLVEGALRLAHLNRHGLLGPW